MDRIRRMREALFRIHRRCHFCGDTATVAPRAYFFLSCQKKVCKKEALDAFYSADARKGVSFCCAYYRYTGGQGTPFGRP